MAEYLAVQPQEKKQTKKSHRSFIKDKMTGRVDIRKYIVEIIAKKLKLKSQVIKNLFLVIY